MKTAGIVMNVGVSGGMKASRDEIITQFEAHCKSRWPREFAKKLKRGFHRNDRVDSAEELYNKAIFFDFEDCYCSVYAFKEWHDEAVIRKHSAIIDCLVFDLDHVDPVIAFKEAKKLIIVLSKTIYTKNNNQIYGQKTSLRSGEASTTRRAR
ncbi:hypothetical protein [Archaeoglobus sp.]